VPEVESLAKNEREKRLISLWRAFRGVGSPYILPPGTPKERVNILTEAMRNTFKDPEFRPYFKKLVADDASPLDAGQLTKVVAEIPRDAETLELLRKLSGAGTLPAR
jgi:tripartite-type tricarboxylate transporter receptor subunit TctC